MSEVIETERLTLRRFDESDCADMARLVGDRAFARWLARVPHRYSVAHGRDFILRNTGEVVRVQKMRLTAQHWEARA